MAKLYTEKPLNSNTFNPKPETINFLLNYSKALKVAVYKGLNFDSIINYYTIKKSQPVLGFFYFD